MGFNSGFKGLNCLHNSIQFQTQWLLLLSHAEHNCCGHPYIDLFLTTHTFVTNSPVDKE